MKIKVNDVEYYVIKNVKDAIHIEELEPSLTDYFDDFDYILGDYAYGKLRLKGFNTKNNKNFKPYNDYEKIDAYIDTYCAKGCRHFVISKEHVGLSNKSDRVTTNQR